MFHGFILASVRDDRSIATVNDYTPPAFNPLSNSQTHSSFRGRASELANISFFLFSFFFCSLTARRALTASEVATLLRGGRNPRRERD